ncbi:MAG TPA: MFS transporter, partial [Phycisphaerales bacterium]|nr:MFS transporter [Phycisphaerales bacterium]
GYVRAGYALPIVGKALLATASAPAMVLVGRLTDRFGKGLRSSPRDALITDMVDPSVRGRAFGFHRMLDTAGALAGVLIAAALMWWLVPAANHGSDGRDHPGALSESANAFRIIFAVASALGLASLALVWLVRDPKSGARDSRHAPEASGRRTRFGVTPDCWRVIALVLIFTLANSTDTFLLLRAGELGHSPFSVVMVYAVFNVTYAAVSYPAGIWSDRLGRWKVIGMGWLIYAAVYAGFAITNAAWVWPLMALYGVFMAFTDGVSKALITDHAPSERRGTALGIFYCLTGLATLLSSYLTGLIWDRVGASAALWLGAGIAAFAVVLIPVLRPGPRPTGKSAA